MDAFSGSWLRDEVIQQNGRPLPRVTWQIAFDEKTMTLTVRREDGTVSGTVRYNLDGTETQSKPDMRHKFRWDPERQVIQLSDAIVGSDNPPRMGLSITETWQLSDGGKVLKMLRMRRKRRLRSEERRVGKECRFRGTTTTEEKQ